MNPEEVFIFRRCPIFFSIIFFSYVKAQNPQNQDSTDIGTSFRPSVAIVIGVLSVMFSLTFLLLLYAKFCHTGPSVYQNAGTDLNQVLIQTRSTRFSGIDKTIIESLPFFRFSSLKGSRKGLECAVCLSKFEDTEILRMLPKCKHAFHINCVDQWLESHSSCPLCRYRVDPEDHSIFTCSNSLPFSGDRSDLTNDKNLELFVKREEDDQGSSRFSVGSSFRTTEKGKKEEILLTEDHENDIKEDRKLLHKFKHTVVVSDVIMKNRWSDVNSSDLMFLNSEMINAMSSKRFLSASSSTNENRTSNTKEDICKIDRSGSSSGPSSTKLLIPSGKRSMSEIINLPRYFGRNKSAREPSYVDGNVDQDERTKKIWFPIARRTIQWFAGREKRLNQSQYSRQLLIV